MSTSTRRRAATRGASRVGAAGQGARDKTTAICLALPSAECADSGDHCIYRVRGKVFAYYLDNHHGDGIVAVCVKSELGENVDRTRRNPERYYLPAYIGPRGWFGIRLDRSPIDWHEVAEVVERSFRLAASKGLLKQLDGA